MNENYRENYHYSFTIGAYMIIGVSCDGAIKLRPLQFIFTAPLIPPLTIEWSNNSTFLRTLRFFKR